MPSPSSSHSPSLKSRLETVIALARLLERVENSPSRIGADQYQALVRQLKAALEGDLPEPARDAILKAHPATAELYENLHYQSAGLSRSPLDLSVSTEMQASQLIHRVARSH